MARKSALEKNERRRTMVRQGAARRARLKAMMKDPSVSLEQRFDVSMKLAQLPRNASRVRIRNRCALTGRPRGVYRKFMLSRIAIRELGGNGMIPGLIKASW